MDPFAKRFSLHKDRADQCNTDATEHSAETAGSYRVAQAIHELGATVCVALQAQRMDAGDLEELGQDLSKVLAAAQNHRGAIDKIRAGKGAYGELRDSIIVLEQAVQKAMAR